MKLIPTVIKLHQKSRFLEVGFSDGVSFNCPCEYLRVYSPSAEVRAVARPVDGKAMVNITAVEPMGSYSVCLVFDDGHNTGIYSWETLYDLGSNYEKNWADYLTRLKLYGLNRGDKNEAKFAEVKTVELLYIAHLAELSSVQGETVTLPTSVTNVSGLLKWLRAKGGEWETAFAEDNIQVIINRMQAELSAFIDSGDEIMLVPLDGEEDQ